MALPDWILGILFRPGETFERARTEMTLSYWWILLSVFTLEAVLILNHPQVGRMVPTPPADLILFNLGVFLLSVYATQVFCLFGVGWLFGWRVSFADAMKFTALVWSLFLLEDMVTFYSYLKEQTVLLFWVSIPFLAWRLVAQSLGISRVSGMPLWKAALVVVLATLPWQAPLLYENWLAAFR
ncbi:MAG: YIP1 family protein [Bacillota bacterium]